MTPIVFEMTRSKVRVTEAFNVKKVLSSVLVKLTKLAMEIGQNHLMTLLILRLLNQGHSDLKDKNVFLINNL